MGGDDSQKLLPWRGIDSSPGRKPPAHYEINTVTETATTFCAAASGSVAQLQTAWVIFGKHRWVSSGACRRRSRRCGGLPCSIWNRRRLRRRGSGLRISSSACRSRSVQRRQRLRNLRPAGQAGFCRRRQKRRRARSCLADAGGGHVPAPPGRRGSRWAPRLPALVRMRPRFLPVSSFPMVRGVSSAPNLVVVVPIAQRSAAPAIAQIAARRAGRILPSTAKGSAGRTGI